MPVSVPLACSCRDSSADWASPPKAEKALVDETEPPEDDASEAPLVPVAMKADTLADAFDVEPESADRLEMLLERPEMDDIHCLRERALCRVGRMNLPNQARNSEINRVNGDEPSLTADASRCL